MSNTSKTLNRIFHLVTWWNTTKRQTKVLVSMQFYLFLLEYLANCSIFKNTSKIFQSEFDKWSLTSVLTDLYINMQNFIIQKTEYAKMLTYCKIRSVQPWPFIVICRKLQSTNIWRSGQKDSTDDMLLNGIWFSRMLVGMH